MGSSRVVALCPKLHTFLTRTSCYLSPPPASPAPGSEVQVSSCIPHRTHLLWEGRRALRKARWKADDERLDVRKSSMRGAFLRATSSLQFPCFHLQMASPPSSPQRGRLHTAVSRAHPLNVPLVLRGDPVTLIPCSRGMSPRGHRSHHLGFKERLLTPYT